VDVPTCPDQAADGHRELPVDIAALGQVGDGMQAASNRHSEDPNITRPGLEQTHNGL
jgi:hypothetical protein